MQAANPYLTFVGEPLLVDWSQDEWAGGCYSAWDNESWQFVEVIKRPFGRVYWAGSIRPSITARWKGRWRVGCELRKR